MKRKHLNYKNFAWATLYYNASVSSPWEAIVLPMTNVWINCRLQALERKAKK
jgi:hypothetical protein